MIKQKNQSEGQRAIAQMAEAVVKAQENLAAFGFKVIDYALKSEPMPGEVKITEVEVQDESGNRFRLEVGNPAPISKPKKTSKFLDCHVSLTIAVRGVDDEAAFIKEVTEEVSGLFSTCGDLAIMDVEVGELHDSGRRS